jgi:hypothetical protein
MVDHKKITADLHHAECEVSRSHSLAAPQSVGLLWTSDQIVAGTSISQHTTLTPTNIHTPGGVQTHNLSWRAAVKLRLRLRSHWDRHSFKSSNV